MTEGSLLYNVEVYAGRDALPVCIAPIPLQCNAIAISCPVKLVHKMAA